MTEWGSRKLPAVLHQQHVQFPDEVLLLQPAKGQVVSGEVHQSVGGLGRYDLEAGFAERYDDRSGLLHVILVEERLVRVLDRLGDGVA